MNITILGCGWLGLPLAKKLLESGNVVKGSTTTREKIQKLKDEGIIPYQIKLFEEGVQGDLEAFLDRTEVLVVDIPPGLRKDPGENYIGKIGRLYNYIKRSGVKHVIFISTTSVFKDTPDFPRYSEDDEANGNAVNATQLKGAENLFVNSETHTTTIVRFGGLFGPGRHPVNYLAERKNIKDPEAPVNLVHLEDCIGIITEIIEQEAWGKIYHGVIPEHPSKEAFYTQLAKEKNLILPEFDHSRDSKGKTIISKNLTDKLDYRFLKGLWD